MPSTKFPQPNSYVDRIKLYVPGEHGTSSATLKPAILSANECWMGPSPLAIAAIKNWAPSAHRYPESSKRLRAGLSEQLAIKADDLIIGAGSDELINLLAQAYLGSEKSLIHSEHGFLMYPIAAQRVGAQCLLVKEKNLKVDFEGIIEASKKASNCGAIFIANPGNPTGSYLNRDELRSFLQAVDKRVLVLIDTAYAEYVTANDYNRALAWIKDYPNLAVCGTFSKIYGLAGLRVGWLAAQRHIIDTVERLRSPFNVSAAAQVAALAALQDTDYTDKVRKQNQADRQWFGDELIKLGLTAPASHANFRLAGFTSEESASSAHDALCRENIFVRKMKAYGLANYLRITIGSKDDLQRLISALKKAI